MTYRVGVIPMSRGAVFNMGHKFQFGRNRDAFKRVILRSGSESSCGQFQKRIITQGKDKDRSIPGI